MCVCVYVCVSQGRDETDETFSLIGLSKAIFDQLRCRDMRYAADTAGGPDRKT